MRNRWALVCTDPRAQRGPNQSMRPAGADQGIVRGTNLPPPQGIDR